MLGMRGLQGEIERGIGNGKLCIDYDEEQASSMLIIAVLFRGMQVGELQK